MTSGKCEEGSSIVEETTFHALVSLLCNTCWNIFPPLIVAGVPAFAHIALHGRLQRLVGICWQPGRPHHDELIMGTHLDGRMADTHYFHQYHALSSELKL